MVLVKWEGEHPPDKLEWMEPLRAALPDAEGCYSVVFRREAGGWRFDLEFTPAPDTTPWAASAVGEWKRNLHPDERLAGEALVGAARQLHAALTLRGKPLDPSWRPFDEPASYWRSHPPSAEPAAAVDGATERRLAVVVPITRAESPLADGNADSTVTTVLPGVEAGGLVESTRAVDGASGHRGLPMLAALGLGTIVFAAAGVWLLSGAISRARAASPHVTLPQSGQGMVAQRPASEAALAFAATPQDGKAAPAGRPAAAAPDPQLSQGGLRWRGTKPAGRPSPAPEPSAAAPSPTAQIRGEEQAIPEPRAAALPEPGPSSADAPGPTTPAPMPASPPAAVAIDPVPAPAPPASIVDATRGPAGVTPGELVDATDPDVKLPVVISEPRPRYPSLAREHMLEGTVELRAQVDDAGAVVAAEVTRAAPSGVGFEEAALDYVRARRYRPATKDGVPVQVWIRIIVKFRMPRG